MATRFFVPLILFVGLAQAQGLAQGQGQRQTIQNPLIDYGAFQLGVDLVAARREAFRVTESEFVRMARDRKTVILDARSREKFEMLHVKGREEPEPPGHHRRRAREDHSFQEHPRSHLLQQQFQQRAASVPCKGFERIAQRVHHECAVRVWLQERL